MSRKPPRRRPRGLVLRSARPGSFFAGADVARLDEVRRLPEAEIARLCDAGRALFARLSRLPWPSVAIIDGVCLGGGLELALACDLLVAAEDAKLVMSYSRIGFSPDGGGSWQLARFLPRQLALKALWLATPLTAAELLAHGLVTQIASKGQALQESLALAAQLARLAPNAVASVKKLAQAALQQDLSAQLDAERDHFIDNLFHANGHEGPTAFLEKRAPQFK